MDDAVLVLTGPTASGKTGLALEVAARTGAEIVSADSRQVYRGMDIGTAKVTPEERAGIPHHGLDLVEPDERYSAGRFARDCRAWLDAIAARGRPAIIVGGTGFFLRALFQPLFREPDLPEDRREPLRRFLYRMDDAALARWVAALEGGELPRDRQRLARRLEVALLSGRTLRWWHEHAPPVHPPLRAPIAVLELPRERLYERIDRRVESMVEQGLLAEVRALREAGFVPGTAPGLNATGYPEMMAVLEGQITVREAVTLTQAATRRYARRQETWFRNQLPANAIRLDGTRSLAALADQAAAMLRTREEVAV